MPCIKYLAKPLHILLSIKFTMHQNRFQVQPFDKKKKKIGQFLITCMALFHLDHLDYYSNHDFIFVSTCPWSACNGHWGSSCPVACKKWNTFAKYFISSNICHTTSKIFYFTKFCLQPAKCFISSNIVTHKHNGANYSIWISVNSMTFY